MPFSIDHNDRIHADQNNANNQDWGSTYKLLSWWKNDVIENARVMVVGAGALGNEVLKNLTLMNVGNILIVDYDIIEYHNLSRSVLFREEDANGEFLKVNIAARRIKDINKNIKLKVINGDITIDVGLGVFRRMDVIIGCLDNRLARLFLNRSCFKVGKTWIDGAIENLIGQVNVYRPEVSCYECSLTEADWQNISAKLGCPDLARRNFAEGRIPTTPISSSIVGAMQVQEALKIIHGNIGQSMAGESFYYEGMNNLILQFKSAPLLDDCESHYEYDPIVESPLSFTDTVDAFLKWVSSYLKTSDPMIFLDHDLALKITTTISEQTRVLVKPKLHLSEAVLSEYRVLEYEDVYIIEETNKIDNQFPYPEISLKEVGIPPLHIIRVWAHEKMHFIELTGDESFLNFS